MGTQQPPPSDYNGDNMNNNNTLDEKSAKQKAIDDWLPINSSRSRKWWFSAFHNVTAMVGAGVLSLPYALGPGVFILVFSWIVTLYTLWQMVEMHEIVPGKRFDRYHELGQYAFGEKLGLYIVVPQQLIVEVSLCIVYMVTGGQSLKKFHDTVCSSCKSIKLTYFIMIFATAQFVLSHLPNFDSISGVSLAAAVMSVSYSTIAWSASLAKGVQEDVQYGYKATTTAGTVFGFLSGLGDVAFAYSGHNVVLEIQATIQSTPERPSKGPMWKGVVVAYIIIALCYFPVALIGYWMFGNSVRDNILISLEKPAWLIAMANMFVVVHVYAMPVFDMMETLLVKKLDFNPTRTLRFIVRNAYVAFTMFIGITFPFFGGLLGFFGGLAYAPTTYYLPCVIWLIVMKPRRGPGVVILILSWLITLYTLWQMVEMHEMVPGKRFDRYHELGQHAFGEKLGLYIVVPQQLICEVGVDIVYMVTGGKSLEKIHSLVVPHKHIKTTYFIMIFASVHFILAHLPNFNSISGVSLAAAVMSLTYSTIAWTASVHKGVQSDVEYGYKASTATGTVFNFLTALGDVAFAYAGHNVVLEIQATIPSTPEKPSKGPMWRGVVIAYIVVALCYFPVALIGYYMFGNNVEDNILISLEKPTWLIVAANMFVVIHVIGSYQLYAMPVFDMIETVLVKKMHFRPTRTLRFIVRNFYVAATMFVAITFPFFGGLLGFFGGFAFAPTTYFLPCIMWLAIYKPKKFSLSWCTNWICIILGLLLMTLSPIGGLRNIIINAKDYHFYS
ncbi:Lysine histidine transporter 1 [Gossypium australe]|uniref:Lysine histidine transporter 1 n=1 Tax=Gossypium australe TaxID=47621 RepID=A0A5B6UR70_9ROSI|nr:Lysine histidine transporter 1 [Gossypium australe]